MSLSAAKGRKEPSETERKRKEHTARILQEKRTERTQSAQDKEFLCVQKFQNHLPRVPSGPYFKPSCLPHTTSDFAGYVISTLEKNYVWQPHQGVDAGLRVDLVDSESVLASSDRSVNAADTKYLADRRATGRSTSIADLERIPWLKRTTYSTNDLYDNVNKFKGPEELHKGYKDRKIRGIGENSDSFDVGYVQYAFDVVPNKLSTVAPKRDKTVLWSMPILPDSREMWCQNFSLVSFGEGTLPEESVGDADADVPCSNKRQRVSRCIMSNIRDIAAGNSSRTDGTLSQQLFAASIAVPGENREENPGEGEYVWDRDLRMDIRNQKLEDHFELSLHEADGFCTYCPLRSRIEMKKLDPKFSQPQSITLQRRQRSTAEVEAEEILSDELGSVK